MGLTKRIFIDKDPAYEDVRQQYGEQLHAFLAEFEFRIPGKRRNQRSNSVYWDPLWPSSLSQAAKQLDIEIVWINGGVFTRTSAQRETVQAFAEKLWQEKTTKF